MGTTFNPGDQVEIICNEEGFQDSYFPATVISEINTNEYIVQYNTLLRQDEQCPLREFRKGDDLRPVPPYVKITRGYDLGDEVDAFANDGWWKGKVAEIVIVNKAKKHCVRFERDGVEMEVSKYWASSIRVHQDWVDGGWVCSKKNLPK